MGGGPGGGAPGGPELCLDPVSAGGVDDALAVDDVAALAAFSLDFLPFFLAMMVTTLVKEWTLFYNIF